MSERTHGRVIRTLAGIVLVTVVAVCDTVGVEDSEMSDVARFLEAIEAIENGAPIEILDEIIGGGKKPWTIIFIDDGPARWDEYFRESMGTVSDKGFWGTGSPWV